MRAAIAAAVVLAACGGGAEPDPIECGAGTMLVGTECVASVVECDPGTHDEGGTCVADPVRYELRIAETTLGANGHTRHRVAAYGTAPDGTPLEDDVILGVDRQAAGTLGVSGLTLGPLGATTFFTPCEAATTGCLGPATLTLALAGAPTDVVAELDVELVAPTDVSTVAPCRVGGNVFYIDGNDYIRHGMVTATDAGYYVDGTTDEVTLSITPANPIQGGNWDVGIDTIDLGIALAPGIYDADRFHTSTPNLAGLSVSGNGHGCNTVAGRVHVYDYAMAGGEVTTITASFEQHCDGAPELLEGCIHYEAP